MRWFSEIWFSSEFTNKINKITTKTNKMTKIICIIIGFVCDFIDFLCEFTEQQSTQLPAMKAVISHFWLLQDLCRSI
jgi:protoheme ferro-lyase